MHAKNKLTIAVIVAIIGLTTAGATVYTLLSGDAQNASTAITTKSGSTLNVDNGSDGIDWSALPTTEVTLANDTLDITKAGTYILTGDSTASVHVNTDGNVRLVLNGVSIKSTTGAAVYIENAETTVVQLADGSSNTLQDASTRSDESIDGALYSSDDLVINGDGSLTVKATFADGIVGKDDLNIDGGTLSVTSVDDGIRGKDSLTITGGTITVDAGDDGIKSTNETEEDKGFVYIKDGSVTISAGDDGIKAANEIVIDDGTVAVKKSIEGIESNRITINGGKVTVYASDDGINATTQGLGGDLMVTFTGGEITVEVGSGDTDGIDSNGDIVVSGGTIRVTNPGIGSGPATAFDYKGTATFTGGTIYINGEQVSEIPAEQMGGGGRPR